MSQCRRARAGRPGAGAVRRKRRRRTRRRRGGRASVGCACRAAAMGAGRCRQSQRCEARDQRGRPARIRRRSRHSRDAPGERVAKLEDEAVRLRVEDTKAEVARIESQRAMSERQVRAHRTAREQLDLADAARRSAFAACGADGTAAAGAGAASRGAARSVADRTARTVLRHRHRAACAARRICRRPARQSRISSTRCISKRACRRR